MNKPSSSAMAAAEKALAEIGTEILGPFASRDEHDQAVAILVKHMQIPEGQWMPIESAPVKEFFLVYLSGWVKPTIGYYHPKYGVIQESGESFYNNKPMYWMPLPAPPKGDEPGES